MSQLKGFNQMASALRRFHDTMSKKLKSEVYKEANYILTDSKQNFVPVDLSTLSNSGFVTLPEWNGNSLSVTIGFGGAAAKYAIVVHEHPSEMDPPSWQGKVITFKPQGRGPKYLEIPLKNAMPGMLERIGSGLKW